jgi:hypothetical protein
VAKRIAVALAAGLAIALWPESAAFAGTARALAFSDRGRFPTSGFEIGLMAGAVVILIVIGFLLRYLSRPRKRKNESGSDKPPRSEADRNRASEGEDA